MRSPGTPRGGGRGFQTEHCPSNYPSRVGGYGRELDLHFDLRKFAQTHEKYIRIRTHSIRNPVSFYLLSSDGAARRASAASTAPPPVGGAAAPEAAQNGVLGRPLRRPTLGLPLGRVPFRLDDPVDLSWFRPPSRMCCKSQLQARHSPSPCALSFPQATIAAFAGRSDWPSPHTASCGPPTTQAHTPALRGATAWCSDASSGRAPPAYDHRPIRESH